VNRITPAGVFPVGAAGERALPTASALPEEC